MQSNHIISMTHAGKRIGYLGMLAFSMISLFSRCDQDAAADKTAVKPDVIGAAAASPPGDVVGKIAVGYQGGLQRPTTVRLSMYGGTGHRTGGNCLHLPTEALKHGQTCASTARNSRRVMLTWATVSRLRYTPTGRSKPLTCIFNGCSRTVAT